MIAAVLVVFGAFVVTGNWLSALTAGPRGVSLVPFVGGAALAGGLAIVHPPLALVGLVDPTILALTSRVRRRARR